MVNPWSNNPNAGDYDEAFFASLSPRIKNAMQIADFAEKRAALEAIERDGTMLVPEIFLYGSDPYTMMKSWYFTGYTWRPSMFGPPVVLAPGWSFPNMPSYDPANPPEHSIKVINPDDRSQWPAPYIAPDVIQPGQSLIGPPFAVINGVQRFYAVMPASRAVANNTPYVENGKNYRKVIVNEGIPFGEGHFWDLVG